MTPPDPPPVDLEASLSWLDGVARTNAGMGHEDAANRAIAAGNVIRRLRAEREAVFKTALGNAQEAQRLRVEIDRLTKERGDLASKSQAVVTELFRLSRLPRPSAFRVALNDLAEILSFFERRPRREPAVAPKALSRP